MQVATAGTMSAAGLEAMRMALNLLEQSGKSSKEGGRSTDQGGFLLAGMLFLATLPALLAGLTGHKLFLNLR